MDWVASIVTLLSMWLVGRKKRIGWGISLMGQIPWFWIIWTKETWGLIPVQVGLCALSVYNWYEWRKEEVDE